MRRTVLAAAFVMLIVVVSIGVGVPPVQASSWSGWTLWDGATQSAVGLAGFFPPWTLFAAARGTDNSIWYRWWGTGWMQIPGYTDATPAVAVFNSLLYVVAKEAGTNNIWYGSEPTVACIGNCFSGWKMLDGSTPSAVSLAADSSYLYLAARAPDGSIWVRRMNSAEVWSGWTKIPGYTDVSPAIVVRQDMLYFVCKEAGTNNIWYSYVSLYSYPNGWSGWKLLDGPTPSAVSLAASSPDGRLFLAARGPDGTIWYRIESWVLVGGMYVRMWSGWTQIPGYTDVQPAIFFLNAELVFVCKESGATRIWWGSVLF